MTTPREFCAPSLRSPRHVPGDPVRDPRGAYADSVALLQVSRTVQGITGVEAAQVAMATPLNLEVLAQMGFTLPAGVTPQEMVVALRLADDAPDSVVDDAEAAIAEALRSRAPSASAEQAPPRTTATALRGTDDGLVLVSVPGPSALVEAMDAVDAGRDVMVFSDNVPLAHEVALKRAAGERGVLVMGPDCGTAVVGGLGLGFANATSPGPVGLVAASGTGCQQVLCLLDRAGVGVTHALGVGGRDLSAAVGGLSTRTALERLDADASVEVIVLVSKPPAAEVAADIEAYAAGLGTPVELAFLGPGRPDLTAATEAVLRRLGADVPEWPAHLPVHERSSGGGFLRGLFVGGTLCDEAMLVAAAALGPVRSTTASTSTYCAGSASRRVMIWDGHREWITRLPADLYWQWFVAGFGGRRVGSVLRQASWIKCQDRRAAVDTVQDSQERGRDFIRRFWRSASLYNSARRNRAPLGWPVAVSPARCSRRRRRVLGTAWS